MKTSNSRHLDSFINTELLNFKGYIFDLWGTLHNGLWAYQKALRTLYNLKSQNKKILLLSNAPRSSENVARNLHKMGITNQLYDRLITSGSTSQDWLKRPENQNKIYYYIGTKKELPHWKKDGLQFTENLEEAEALLLVDTCRKFDSEDKYIDTLRSALSYNLPLICPNPDRHVRIGIFTLLCAGQLALRYQQLGGEITLIGKPEKLIYEEVFQYFQEEKIEKTDLLALGDCLYTDIAGANQSNISSLWISNGIHRDELKNTSQEALMNKYQAFPTYISGSLAWD